MTLAFASCLISFEDRDVCLYILLLRRDLHNLLLLLAMQIHLNFHRNHFLLLIAFLFNLFFISAISAIVVVQLIKNSHYICTQH
jgi:uncharacterized membrane protein